MVLALSEGPRSSPSNTIVKTKQKQHVIGPQNRDLGRENRDLRCRIVITRIIITICDYGYLAYIIVFLRGSVSDFK